MNKAFRYGERLVFRAKRKTVSVYCRDIVFFESYGHYITIHMNDKSTYTTRCTISYLITLLDDKTFVRVHRGIIVNLEYVKQLNYTGAVLSSAWGRVPVSRSYRDIAEKAFEKFNNRT